MKFKNHFIISFFVVVVSIYFIGCATAAMYGLSAAYRSASISTLDITHLSVEKKSTEKDSIIIWGTLQYNRASIGSSNKFIDLSATPLRFNLKDSDGEVLMPVAGFVSLADTRASMKAIQGDLDYRFYLKVGVAPQIFEEVKSCDYVEVRAY